MAASDITRVRRFFERGVYFLNQNQYADAATNFKDALHIIPHFLPARTHLALVLAKQRKYLDAIKLLEEGRKLVPLRDDQRVEVFRLLSIISLTRQDYPAASYYAKAALKIAPNDASLKLLMANCLCKSCKFEAGLDALLACAKMDQ